MMSEEKERRSREMCGTRAAGGSVVIRESRHELDLFFERSLSRPLFPPSLLPPSLPLSLPLL